MNLSYYRNKDIERERTSDLMGLIALLSDHRGSALDVGARDGWFSCLLAKSFDKVTALDLKKPFVDNPKVECVEGNIIDLKFSDGEYDLVFCSEVLEHIQPKYLKSACFELQRVSRRYIVIGVPFKQDIRIGRTKCYTCGKRNPPWGHVNSFDESRLVHLFNLCKVRRISYVGSNIECTNPLSVLLMDLVGNPYGTYHQEECCIHCGATLKKPPSINIMQKIFTKISFKIRNIQQCFHRAHPNWIHILFERARF
jgi:hypothetical protein